MVMIKLSEMDSGTHFMFPDESELENPILYVRAIDPVHDIDGYVCVDNGLFFNRKTILTPFDELYGHVTKMPVSL